ncbi:cytidylyltransferase domain-containing protein [Hyunsoonleella ulvae]|uniref:cytidylyltransferase domain-containing protein n=1 Tax=Hyunsoonleella ulvae TaxID=2799948 RepID=UPI001939BE87|nr:hypothetical protein [Hyunsoonleella ulvae]
MKEVNKKNLLKVLVIVPARGGSKGIPRKNLRALNRKPLIFYSINNALSIKNCSVDCYVSTDDDEINLIALKFGAKTISRDSEISDDNTTLDPVIFDAFTKISSKENKQYDYVITLQATSPLLRKETLDLAISEMEKNNIDTLISGVYDSHLTWLKTGDNYVANYEKRVNRQFLPKIYKETGGFVITKSKFVTKKSRFGKNIQIFPLTKRESIDIDDYEDWNLCEFYLSRKVLLFVVTGNSSVGMGHVYNTLSIANEILKHRIVFLVDSSSKLAYKKISEYNYEVHIQKEEDILQDILNLKADIIINDKLDTERGYVKKLKDEGLLVINFEDLGSGSKEADLVINAMYPEERIIPNHYYGAKYFILRDEFLLTKKKEIIKSVKQVLISFGGVDPNNFTDRVLGIISNYCNANNINITVILGMGYEFEDKLKEDYNNITIKHNVNNISDEILNSDLVFTSAGRTTFEVASIGVPSIVLCQNNRETTHFFASQKNGFYNLGLGSEVNDSTIFEVFQSTLSFDIRLLMHQRMQQNGINKGKERVIKLINQTISNKFN